MQVREPAHLRDVLRTRAQQHGTELMLIRPAPHPRLTTSQPYLLPVCTTQGLNAQVQCVVAPDSSAATRATDTEAAGTVKVCYSLSVLLFSRLISLQVASHHNCLRTPCTTTHPTPAFTILRRHVKHKELQDSSTRTYSEVRVNRAVPSRLLLPSNHCPVPT